MCALALIAIFVTPAFAKKNRNTSPKRPLRTPDTSKYSTQFQKELLKYLGVRYRRGGSTAQGLDCSGFAGLVYRTLLGVDLPHQAGSQFLLPTLRKVPMDDLDTGDLVFFTPSGKSKRISHVGIYLADGDFVHAARGKGVIISSLDDPYWRTRVVGAKRAAEQQTLERSAGRAPIEGSSLNQDQGFFFAFHEPTYASISNPGMPGMLPGHPASQSFGLELGYAKALLGEAWDLRLSAFRDTLSSWRGAPAYAAFSADEEYPLSTNLRDFASIQGLRVASDLRLFEWLRVTPSVSYLNYGDTVDDTGLPRRSVGLDLAMGYLSEGWILSTGLQYSSSISTKMFSYDTDVFDTVGTSFTLARRLSDNWHVALVGERTHRLDVSVFDSARDDRDWEEQRFSIMFSFSR